MTTVSAKKEDVNHEWYLVDAKDKTLGRLSTEIALRLRGKHKPIYTPHVDTGDYIVVINASGLKVTGKKMQDKIYYKHTGYIGNLKSMNLATMMKKSPETVLTRSVRGMLPKTKLGNVMIKKLKVFAGPEHTHTAQQPKILEI
jgi:large subunit ribosomal protein L13